MNRRELCIKLVTKINGTFGNLLADIRSNDYSYALTFARLKRTAQDGYYLDQHIMVILYLTDDDCAIWKSNHLNGTFKTVYYSELESITVDELYEALRRAIGYNY